MNYTHYSLGYLRNDSTVEVTLSGNGANVRLLDNLNFQSYKAGRQHRYHGGLMKSSPASVVIPSTGTWHLVVDMQGLSGSVRSSIRVLS